MVKCNDTRALIYLPHYLDIGDGEKWRALVYAMLRELRAIVERKEFRVVDEATICCLEQ